MQEIEPIKYKNEIYKIQKKAYAEYPKKYRPKVDKVEIYKEIDGWNFYKSYGVFCNIENKLIGYALISKTDKYLYYAIHKVMPQYEKNGVNAALVYGVLTDINILLEKGYCLSDGSKNILHESGFQEYLEKYFGFRKVYCTLHIKYRYSVLKILIKVMYRFKNILYKFDGNKINGLLKMEESLEEA